MNNILLGMLLAVALSGGAIIWYGQTKIDQLEQRNEALVHEKTALTTTIQSLEARAALAEDAATVARKERARVQVQSAKYETVRDAFRKGDFDAQLPDDFKFLIACLLWRSTGNDTEGVNCP